MGFTQAFKLALKSLAGSKLRAFLTMLGIIIGVGSVIILVSLMQGMTGEVTSMFEDMGTNMLTVNVTGRGSSRTADVDDMYDLYEENTDVFMGMSPTVIIMGSVKTATDSDSFSSTSVSGVSEQYAEINGLAMQNGRFISYADLEARSKVAVVGTYVHVRPDVQCQIRHDHHTGLPAHGGHHDRYHSDHLRLSFYPEVFRKGNHAGRGKGIKHYREISSFL